MTRSSTRLRKPPSSSANVDSQLLTCSRFDGHRRPRSRISVYKHKQKSHERSQHHSPTHQVRCPQSDHLLQRRRKYRRAATTEDAGSEVMLRCRKMASMKPEMATLRCVDDPCRRDEEYENTSPSRCEEKALMTNSLNVES